MNEMETLETRLRSWKPRQPSPSVKRRLFGSVELPLWQPALMRILLPAAACLVLTVAALNPSHDVLRVVADPREVGAMSLSNQSYAAYLPGSFQCEANRLDTFGWTNGGGISSLMDFVSPQKADN